MAVLVTLRYPGVEKDYDGMIEGVAPQSQGLEAIAEGFRLLYDDDHAQLAAESVVYDALYRYCQGQEERP